MSRANGRINRGRVRRRFIIHRARLFICSWKTIIGRPELLPRRFKKRRELCIRRVYPAAAAAARSQRICVRARRLTANKPPLFIARRCRVQASGNERFPMPPQFSDFPRGRSRAAGTPVRTDLARVWTILNVPGTIVLGNCYSFDDG